jgi:hypothetical protein
MCSLDDLEYASVWHETKLRARKHYKCNTCGGAIRPGDHYIRHFDVSDGEPTRERCCLPCEESRAAFRKAHHGGFSPSNHADELVDCIENADTDEERQPWRDALAALRRRQRAAKAGEETT